MIRVVYSKSVKADKNIVPPILPFRIIQGQKAIPPKRNNGTKYNSESLNGKHKK